MSSIAYEEIGRLMESLSEERQRMAVNYIRFLAFDQGSASPVQTLKSIQSQFKDDTGWSTEEEMLAEMASFRRNRRG